ncbi:MAG: hypothetical protein HY917_00750 [Candidatus Diapherotrites archaeon]|nr:hypothetical protein [Candidatus Diapherotrites archaeon]
MEKKNGFIISRDVGRDDFRLSTEAHIPPGSILYKYRVSIGPDPEKKGALFLTDERIQETIHTVRTKHDIELPRALGSVWLRVNPSHRRITILEMDPFGEHTPHEALSAPFKRKGFASLIEHAIHESLPPHFGPFRIHTPNPSHERKEQFRKWGIEPKSEHSLHEFRERIKDYMHRKKMR